MAGVQTLEEEFLSCSICTEIYTDPCTLGCQHSFCRKCVTEYINTRPDAVQSKTIPCAMCRQATPVPNPTRPHNEWAKQLRPSLMLNGLMDRHHREHIHTKDQDVCFLCKEAGETTAGSSWCSDCEMTLCSRCATRHLIGPATKKHDVYDLSEGVKVKERRKVKCKEHEGEAVKFVCKDCNKTACQTCCIIKHRKCEDVVTIESMVPEIKSVLTEKRRILEKRKKENMTGLKKEESKVAKMLTRKAGGKSEIKSAFEEAIALMRKKEKQLLDTFDDLSDKQIVELQANVKSGQITNQMYQQHCEFIDQALQSESEVDMYDMYQVCLSGAVESVVNTESDVRNTSVVMEVKFTPNMEPLKNAINDMGKVILLKGETEFSQSKQGSSILATPLLECTLNIKHRDDTEIPDPIDITILTVFGIRTIVVADCRNKCLKSVYNRYGRREVSRLHLPDTPYRIYEMTGNRVAFLGGDTDIKVAEVKPELCLIFSLKTSKRYTGLALLSDSTLVVGSAFPGSPCIDLLNSNGCILKSFTSQNTGLELIWEPQYICITHDGNILVSDIGSKSVYCLTPQGSVIFTSKTIGVMELKDPRGIIMSKTADILLADSKSCKVIQLKSDGTFVRDLLSSANGIVNPWGLHIDEDNKLYVCDRSIANGGIKVFRYT